MRINGRKWCVAIVTALLALGVAGQSAAQTPGKGRPVRPSIVESVSTSSSTITIHGRTYRVTSSSRLADVDGNRITVSDLRGRSGSYGGDMVEFSVSPGTMDIHTLKIIPVRLP